MGSAKLSLVKEEEERRKEEGTQGISLNEHALSFKLSDAS